MEKIEEKKGAVLPVMPDFGEKKEETQAQKIKRKIAELKKLETIEKKINKFRNSITKLEEERKELEKKYGV